MVRLSPMRISGRAVFSLSDRFGDLSYSAQKPMDEAASLAAQIKSL